jgi:hypothetical protein
MDKLWGEKDAAENAYTSGGRTRTRYRKASNAVKSASRKFQNEHWQRETTAHDRRDRQLLRSHRRHTAPRRRRSQGSSAKTE